MLAAERVASGRMGEDAMVTAGAVASPHGAATRAGLRALADGGSAVDAAITAAAVLAVVAPDQCGLGGDAVALVARSPDEVACFQGAGRSAGAVDVDEVRRAGSGQMPALGAHSVTVPGALSTWGAMHGHSGRLPWSTLLEPAREVAAEGFAVGERLHRSIAGSTDRMSADAGLRSLVVPGGVPLAVGSRLRQPELAATLAVLAGEGPAALYQGELGAQLLDFLRESGSALSAADLAGHTCDLSSAVSTGWSGTRLWTAPPPSQGLLLFQILAGMDDASGDRDWLGEGAGQLANLFARSVRYREANLADPIGIPGLLDVGAWLATGDDGSTPVRRPDGDTVAVVAVDDDGCFVSLIFSLFDGFGSGLRDPATGIVLHNRGAGFTLDEGSPNCLAPGRRPAHSLMPVLVADAGGLLGAHGTMGGYGQPQIHAQLVLRLASGLTPQQAVAAPRFVVGSVRRGWAASHCRREVGPRADGGGAPARRATRGDACGPRPRGWARAAGAASDRR